MYQGRERGRLQSVKWAIIKQDKVNLKTKKFLADPHNNTHTPIIFKKKNIEDLGISSQLFPDLFVFLRTSWLSSSPLSLSLSSAFLWTCVRNKKKNGSPTHLISGKSVNQITMA